MATNQNHNIPNDMKEIYRRFIQCRRSHTGRLPIPDPLWGAAAEMARKHGINACLPEAHYVSAQLGHKSPEITLRVYSHWIPGTKRLATHALDCRSAENPQKAPIGVMI